MRVDDTTGRQQLAQWMLRHGIATGHGDTINDLLSALEDHLDDMRTQIRVLKQIVGM